MDDILNLYPGIVCPACKISALELSNELVLCKACGTNYELLDRECPILIPPNAKVSHEEIKIQDKAAVNYENLRYHKSWARAYHEWWTRLMISQVDVSGRILDNGCGTGALFEHLPNADIIGLDLSSEMIRLARTRSKRVLISDSQRIPFADESFDTIFARSLLHHLNDYHTGIQEMARVLCKGGEVVSVDTNKSVLSILPRRLLNKDGHFSNEHKNFHRQELIKAFSQQLDVQYVGFFGYVAYPILGFPDIINIFRFFPLKTTSYNVLMKIDCLLARIPWINSLGWALLIKAKKNHSKN